MKLRTGWHWLESRARILAWLFVFVRKFVKSPKARTIRIEVKDLVILIFWHEMGSCFGQVGIREIYAQWLLNCFFF